MRTWITLTGLLAGLMTRAHAGSVPEGTSSHPGFFLGMGTQAYFSSETPKDYLGVLRKACKSGRKIWALDVATPFTCTEFSYMKEGGDGPVYAMELDNPQAADTAHARLFSLRPFARPVWTARKPTRAEIDILARHPELAGKDHAPMRANLRAGKARAIEAANGKAVIFLLPGAISNDGIVDEVYNLLVTQRAAGALAFQAFRGKVVGLADLNGDGVPELQISTGCDGTCESVISVMTNAPVNLAISNH